MVLEFVRAAARVLQVELEADPLMVWTVNSPSRETNHLQNLNVWLLAFT